jgi:hypothetical protein
MSDDPKRLLFVFIVPCAFFATMAGIAALATGSTDPLWGVATMFGVLGLGVAAWGVGVDQWLHRDRKRGDNADGD